MTHSHPRSISSSSSRTPFFSSQDPSHSSSAVATHRLARGSGTSCCASMPESASMSPTGQVHSRYPRGVHPNHRPYLSPARSTRISTQIRIISSRLALCLALRLTLRLARLALTSTSALAMTPININGTKFHHVPPNPP